ncbi:DUF6090 family protein [Robiginitalea sp. SC105]|uniref:DUF6090 family protein n=1 Tax=Robiginitalea sp. SC105 TaxID=2762332 RepID=UPI00163A6CF1|nr:DUF6090 family protein [Robiginitalea sp. SC105]MBC2839659.1 hypothetical protein [Robiginitalea sp. SC105]
MLSLLRRARRNLLEKKNFSHYLLYALGEVILIVIGILIALWISNANEDSQRRQREQFYLGGLQAEFEQSRAKLEILVEVNRQTYSRARVIADAIASPDSVLSESELAVLLFQAFSDDLAYNPNNSLLQEMLNAGRMELLGDTELRKHLTSWSARIERIRQQETSLREQRYRVLDVAREGTGSIRSIFENTGVASGELGLLPSADPGSNLPLLDSPAFENNVLIFILTSVYTEKMHYQPLLEEIDAILALIEKSRVE